jgi:glycogen synthase
MSDTSPLKILLLAAEAVPFAKTGGLADVVGALPGAIRAPWGTTSGFPCPATAGSSPRDSNEKRYGVDYESANPATDPHIAANYDAASLAERPANKLELQRQAELTEDASIPLIGIISRLTDSFVFEEYDRWMLFSALVRALETYKHADVWRRIQQRGMAADFSWQQSASKYVRVYQRAIASRIPRPGLETVQVCT